MQELCPPLETNFPFYAILLRCLSIVSIPINLFSIYCIAFKSHRAMRSYKWHLLWHQILTATADFLIGVMSIPIYLNPFPMVFPTSFIQYVMPTHIAVVLIFLTITWSLAAIVQLFVYRYLKATGRDNFPCSYIILLIFTYAICATPSIGFEIIYPKDQKNFMREMMKNFSCVTKEIANIPAIAGYPPNLIGKFVGMPILLVNVYMIAVCSTLIYWTKTFLRGNNLSPSTAKLERKFLVTLILQVLSPVLIVHTPGLVLMYIQSQRIYGYQVIGLVCVATLSIYGALCGIFIIFLTPTYRNVVFCVALKQSLLVSSIEPTGYSNPIRRLSVKKSPNDRLFISKKY